MDEKTAELTVEEKAKAWDLLRMTVDLSMNVEAYEMHNTDVAMNSVENCVKRLR